MAEISRFFDAASYSEADQAEVQNRFRSTGVIGGIGAALVVGAPGGMFVSVGAGEAMVEGFWYKNTATLNLPVSSNTSGLSRTDLVVLRLDRVSNTLSAAVVEGTPGAGTPILTQLAGTVWEIALATITIPTGTTSAITAGMLADLRTYSRTVRNLRDIADGVVGYDALINGAVTNLLLNYKAATDLFTGGSLGAASTYNNIIAAQSFTVSQGALFLIVSVQLSLYMTNASGGNASSTHIIVDGTTRYMLAPGHNASLSGLGAQGGTIIIPAPSAGAHTIGVQDYSSASKTQVWLRAATQPGYEGAAMQVLEIRR